MRQFNKVGIINTPGVVNVSYPAGSTSYVAGQVTICDADNTNPIVDQFVGLPISNGESYKITALAERTEVQQIAVIGKTAEVIDAAERYGVEIGTVTRKYESKLQQPARYAIKAPTVLSGTAATDRANIFTILQDKINADPFNKVTAAVMHKIAYTLGTTTKGVTGSTTVSPLVNVTTVDKVRVGAPGVQETSAITMNVAAITVTSGTITGGDAAGFIWVYGVSDLTSWNTGVKTLTFTDAVLDENIIVTTNAAPTEAQGLVITDDAGYFSEIPNRLGASLVKLYGDWDIINGSVTGAEVSIDCLSKYARGKGTDLTAKVPVYGTCGHDEFISGDAWMEKYKSSVLFSATNYATVLIEKMGKTSMSGMLDERGDVPSLYQIFVENDTPNGAAHPSFDADTILFIDELGTAIGCTPVYISATDVVE
jgi:hypothetical protein